MSLHHCVFNLQFHLVLVTKYRRKVIHKPILEKLHEHLKYLIQERWDSQLIEFNGEPDHVHLLISLNPKMSPSVFVNNIKTVTSRIIRRDLLNISTNFTKNRCSGAAATASFLVEGLLFLFLNNILNSKQACERLAHLLATQMKIRYRWLTPPPKFNELRSKNYRRSTSQLF